MGRSTQQDGGGEAALEPALAMPEGSPRAIALVLHGGKASSFGPVSPRGLVVLRMQPFVRAIQERTDVGVATLRYRYRGWNEPHAHPVDDVRFALGRLEERHGRVPVILVGHSMGGRAALRVGGHPLVRAVVGLAPWLPGSEPVEQLAGRDIAILHGTRDHTTSLAASERYAARAQSVTRSLVCLRVPWSGHAMLRRAELWHRLTADFVAAAAENDPMNPVATVARAAGCRDCRQREAGAEHGAKQ